MEEKSKLENPEKQAKTEVQDKALAEINGGGLGPAVLPWSPAQYRK